MSSLFFTPFRPPISVCVASQCLSQTEQQVFAGRNSDTWMHPVRQLIRDSTPPLSPNLEERRVHILTNTCMHIYKCTKQQVATICLTNQSRQGQRHLIGWI